MVTLIEDCTFKEQGPELGTTGGGRKAFDSRDGTREISVTHGGATFGGHRQHLRRALTEPQRAVTRDPGRPREVVREVKRVGGRSRDRTCDHLVVSEVLYR